MLYQCEACISLHIKSVHLNPTKSISQTSVAFTDQFKTYPVWKRRAGKFPHTAFGYETGYARDMTESLFDCTLYKEKGCCFLLAFLANVLHKYQLLRLRILFRWQFLSTSKLPYPTHATSPCFKCPALQCLQYLIWCKLFLDNRTYFCLLKAKNVSLLCLKYRFSSKLTKLLRSAGCGCVNSPRPICNEAFDWPKM